MEIGVLGPVLVTIGGRAIRLPAKQQTLLAMLALEPNAPVSADRLMSALWGEDVPPTALPTLQSHVFQLRRLLATEQSRPGTGADAGGAAAVETEGRAYRLRIAPAAIDARRFEALLAAGRTVLADDPRAAADHLARALALWRRPGAPDVGDEPAAIAELERLAELRNGAVDELIALRLRLGEAASVIPDLRRELGDAPYREPLWAALMAALAATGRKSEALIAYRDATAALREELDVDPSDELQALAAGIRNGGGGGRFRGFDPSPAVRPKPSGPLELPRADRSRRVIRRPALGVAALGVAVVVIASGSRLIPAPPSQAPAAPSAGAATPPPITLAADGIGQIDADGRLVAGTALDARPDNVTLGAGSLWITSPADGTVLRVDEDTGAVIQRIRVGHAPDGIAFGFGAVWVANSDDRTVDRIDPATSEVVASVEVGTAPSGIAIDDRWVWVANRLDHSVTRIDPSTGHTRAFAVGGTPIGITTADGSVWIVDTSESVVDRMDPTTGQVTRTVAAGSAPTAIASSPTGDAIWVVNSGSGTVFRIGTATATVTAAQTVGNRPTGIVVDSDGAWVAVSSPDQIVRLDLDTAQITGRTPLAATPHGLADDNGRIAFTANEPTGSHRGGTLRVIAAPADLAATPDPTYAQWGIGGLSLITNDALVTYKRVGGPDGLTIVPDLADEIPSSPDGGRTWTFHLRAGLVYSDRRPVRAGDALRSFERAVLAGNVPAGAAGMFGDTEIEGSAACGVAPPCDLTRGITTDDSARTITFHLTAADAGFPDRIFDVPILPPDTPLTEVSVPMVATGPYQVSSFRPGASEELVRNPHFQVWSADAQPDGNPDEIDVRQTTAPDPAVEVTSGSADVLHVETEPASRMDQLRTQVPGLVHVAPSVATWFEMMNTRLPPFDDVRVREAVNLATDRAALVGAWGGPLTATVTCQIVPPGFSGYQRYCPWTVDPGANGNWLGPDLTRARQLIDRAGVAGERVTVWGADDSGQHAAVARSFTRLLDDLGFRATTRLLSFDDFFSLVFEHPERIQMAGYWIREDDRSGASLIRDGFGCPAAGQGFGDAPSEWCDRSVDDRMQAARTLAATDPVGADERWAGIDHAIVDAAPAVMAFNTTDVTLLSSRVGGFEDNPVILLYDQLWVQ